MREADSKHAGTVKAVSIYAMHAGCNVYDARLALWSWFEALHPSNQWILDEAEKFFARLTVPELALVMCAPLDDLEAAKLRITSHTIVDDYTKGLRHVVECARRKD